MSKTFDRTTQDVGNMLALEHVNVTVPDQEVAALFYVGAGETSARLVNLNCLTESTDGSQQAGTKNNG